MNRPLAGVTGAASGIGLELAEVARVGFDAMMRGDGDVVSGSQSKLRSSIVDVISVGVLAEQHRRMAEPGSGKK